MIAMYARPWTLEMRYFRLVLCVGAEAPLAVREGLLAETR
jgi:hypothetical protein